MATKNPRVPVMLEPELYDLVKELSELNGQSMSKIIRDVVFTIAPVLQRVVEAGRRYVELEAGVQERIVEQFRTAEAAVIPQAEALEAEIRQLLASIPAAAEDPRPVTRGSRPPSKRGEQHANGGLS